MAVYGKAIYRVLAGKLMENGLTYEAAAELCGIKRNTFALKMTGKRQWVIAEINILCKVCKLPFEELFRV